MTASAAPAAPAATPTFGETLRVWAVIGVLSFGGPAGQIALMHRMLVEERGWVGERRFLHALNYCMLLPGPEAQQLAVYLGWLLHRTLGGVLAGLLFLLPGAAVMLGLSAAYLLWGETALLAGLFYGLKAAVLAVVVQAVVRIGRRALAGVATVVIAVAAFLAIFLLDLPFPAIIAGAALAGWLQTRWAPDGADEGPRSDDGAVDELLAGGGPAHARPSLRRALAVAAVCLVLWALPFLLVAWLLGTGHVLFDVALFFSKLAVVSFGGAYAVLAYMAQAAVETHGWLSAGEMLDGLGLAETTPGPLIMVTQFVGFLAAAREAGGWPPLAAGAVGALVTTWVTFVPCFLWILLGAPWVERLRRNRALAGALAGITAAVVGVILNVALWFGMHVVFGEVGEARLGPLHLPLPDPASLDPAAALLAFGAMLATFRFRLGLVPVFAACGALGLALTLLD